MLNPTTADPEKDNPTIRRCIGFAKKWGYKKLEVVNLFALCTTEPEILSQAADPVGPENNMWLKKSSSSAGIVVAAWGEQGKRLQRDKKVMQLLSGIDLHCLGNTKQGYPRHPLYVSADTKPQKLVVS